MPDREKAIRILEGNYKNFVLRHNGELLTVNELIALLKAQEPITGETSDGYHTFNELYHHRAVLFSVIVANYPDRAWKSKKHHDGTMYNGMFIVGIDTPDGQATYHYDVDPYWDMFKCRVLDNAPEWDGHTPAQAIERIGKLKAQEPMVMAGAELTDAELIEAIRKAPLILNPAVDAVPIIRCANCKWWNPGTLGVAHRCAALNIATTGEFYCAAAERKSNAYADQSGAEYADNPTV